jgi:hypothetical protein
VKQPGQFCRKSWVTAEQRHAQHESQPANEYNWHAGRSRLLTAKRDRKAALRFLYKAAGQPGTPAKITIDKSSASTAAIESYNAEHDTEVEIRQVKYLNNVV